MPEITSCPDCEKKLRVPDDLLGKKVRCPSCGTMFVAKAVAEERDDREEEEEERPRKPKLSRSEGIRQERDRDDEDDRPRRRSRRDGDEEEEDDRPRRKARRDEEDEDDRPRSRRRDEEYEDEDAHRSRRRRRDEEDDEDDYDDRPRGRDVQSWRGVRAGLNLVVIAGWLYLGLLGVVVLGGGILLLTGASLLSNAAAAGPPQPGARPPAGFGAALGGACVLICILGLLGLAEFIVKMIGLGMCMQVPPNRSSSARGLCIAAFCCACGAFLISFTGGAIQGASGGFGAQGAGAPASNPMFLVMGVGNVFGWISNLLSFAAFILWLFFLRAICLQLRNSAVASKVLTLFIAQLIFIVLSILLSVVMVFVIGLAAFSAAGPGGGVRALGAGVIAFMVMLFVIFLIHAGLYVWYVLTVQDVRGVVERHLARR